jgi:hypothetical protein
MHGFTNFQQSKALYERGYRHPNKTFLTNAKCEYSRDWITCREPMWFSCFSLADIVTMQGIIYHKPDDAPMPDIIQSYVESCLSEPEGLVLLANQRLREVYK